jgi:predicted small lipoprotein YifL
MSRSRCTDTTPASVTTPLLRRAVMLGLLVSLGACGVKGGLELPPPEPFEGEPDAMEDPETYGDPMTFPEPGENEEEAE